MSTSRHSLLPFLRCCVPALLCSAIASAADVCAGGAYATYEAAAQADGLWSCSTAYDEKRKGMVLTASHLKVCYLGEPDDGKQTSTVSITGKGSTWAGRLSTESSDGSLKVAYHGKAFLLKNAGTILELGGKTYPLDGSADLAVTFSPDGKAIVTQAKAAAGGAAAKPKR